ncbi:MAG: hypothetical protein WDZ74_02035 [Candidatus Paceibacterota bacterium]
MSEDDILEKLKKQLYSRDGVRRSHTQDNRRRDEPREESSDWPYEEEPVVFREPLQKKVQKAAKATVNKYFSLFVILSVVIFILTSLFVGYRLFFAGSLISPRNVDIEVNAPATARAGDKVVVVLSITNRNKVDLLDAELVVTLPDDTLSADESGNEVDEITRSLGVIGAGETVEEEIEILLFGQEEDEVEILFDLDYGTENSNARLSNSEVHTIRISTAPVSILIVPSAKEVQSGNQFEIEIDIISNTTAPLDGLLLHVEYPGGFNFVSSNPSPVADTNIWRIGDLRSQERETVTLRGYLEGQNDERRFFKVTVGEEGDGGYTIGRLFASAEESVNITAPQIALSTEINKSGGQTVSSMAGEQVTVSIRWGNTLRDVLRNMVIEAEIDEQYILRDSIKVEKGFYQSSTDIIQWDRTTDSNLASIESLGRGSVTFSFTVADGNALANAINPEIPISIRARASEPQGVDSSRDVENTLERVVRIASDIVISQSSTPAGGANPPRSEMESLYVVRWMVGNSGNQVNGASVRAALPSYVTFVESEDESVRFSPLTNEVIWNVGTIAENTSFSSNLQTSFTISFTPSRSQIGKPALLVYDALIEGRDSFTGSLLRSHAASLQSSTIIE